MQQDHQRRAKQLEIVLHTVILPFFLNRHTTLELDRKRQRVSLGGGVTIDWVDWIGANWCDIQVTVGFLQR
jgi:hypothetical protein